LPLPAAANWSGGRSGQLVLFQLGPADGRPSGPTDFEVLSTFPLEAAREGR
jgi:hypothetical protein